MLSADLSLDSPLNPKNFLAKDLFIFTNIFKGKNKKNKSKWVFESNSQHKFINILVEMAIAVVQVIR